jgi:hypothetical protein
MGQVLDEFLEINLTNGNTRKITDSKGKALVAGVAGARICGVFYKERFGGEG